MNPGIPLGFALIVSGIVAMGTGLYYDWPIEIIPGMTMPRHLVNKMDYFSGIGSDGQWHEWKRTP